MFALRRFGTGRRTGLIRVIRVILLLVLILILILILLVLVRVLVLVLERRHVPDAFLALRPARRRGRPASVRAPPQNAAPGLRLRLPSAGSTRRGTQSLANVHARLLLELALIEQTRDVFRRRPLDHRQEALVVLSVPLHVFPFRVHFANAERLPRRHVRVDDAERDILQRGVTIRLRVGLPIPRVRDERIGHRRRRERRVRRRGRDGGDRLLLRAADRLLVRRVRLLERRRERLRLRLIVVDAPPARRVIDRLPPALLRGGLFRRLRLRFRSGRVGVGAGPFRIRRARAATRRSPSPNPNPRLGAAPPVAPPLVAALLLLPLLLPAARSRPRVLALGLHVPLRPPLLVLLRRGGGPDAREPLEGGVPPRVRAKVPSVAVAVGVFVPSVTRRVLLPLADAARRVPPRPDPPRADPSAEPRRVRLARRDAGRAAAPSLPLPSPSPSPSLLLRARRR